MRLNDRGHAQELHRNYLELGPEFIEVNEKRQTKIQLFSTSVTKGHMYRAAKIPMPDRMAKFSSRLTSRRFSFCRLKFGVPNSVSLFTVLIHERS